MKRQSEEHKLTNYTTVSSIDKYSSKIKEKGGKIIVSKTEIPNMGCFEIFLDTEGNMIGLYEGNQT